MLDITEKVSVCECDNSHLLNECLIIIGELKAIFT
jgi:hypothetical protein